MKSFGKTVIWSILCIVVFALTAVMPAFAAGTPAARLEGDAIEPAEVTEITNAPVNELPSMDFVPVQSSEKDSTLVVEESAPVVQAAEPVIEQENIVVEKKDARQNARSSNRKLSKKIREYWLKIHEHEAGEAAPLAETKKLDTAAAEPVKPAVVMTAKKPVAPKVMRSEEISDKTVVAQKKPVEEKSDKLVIEEKTMEKNKVITARSMTKDEFAPAPVVNSPPLSDAPLVVQKKSSKLALFSASLAKMAQRREYRMAEAKRLNVVLPSQGGSFDKLPQSICKIKTTVEDILTRNGAGMAISMIFKGRFAGSSTNLKHTNK